MLYGKAHIHKVIKKSQITEHSGFMVSISAQYSETTDRESRLT
jgi:hypothetical protein